MFDAQFILANEMFAAGNLAAVDIICRDVLAADPGNANALNFIGVVAAQIGELDKAKDYFTAAGDAQAAANLDMLKQFAPRPMPRGPHYLLIKAWGYGFWSDVTQVLGSLFLAELTGRIPVVHWGPASLFGDGTGDAFTRYFLPVTNITLEDLCRVPRATFFPPKWTHENLRQDKINKWSGDGSRSGVVNFLHRPETIAVSDFYIGTQHVLPWANTNRPLDTELRRLAQTYLNPQPAITKAAGAFVAAHFKGAPFAAIHLRGSDKYPEDADLAANNAALVAALDRLDPACRIFLLTDDEKNLADMKTRFGERLVATQCQRTDTETGLHHLPDTDRARAGREVMIDACIALRAERFFGNPNSNVAAMIGVMKDWQPGCCTLIGSSIFERSQLPLYVRRS